MLHDAMSLADGGPVAIRYPRGQARNVGEHEVGVGIRARARARRRRRSDDARLRARHRQARRRRPRRPPTQLAAAGVEATVWDVRCCAPLDDDMLADAARHGAVVTCRGRRPRRRHRDGDRGPHRRPRARGVPVEVLGLPTRFIPHDGRPERHPRPARPRRRRNRRRRPPVADWSDRAAPPLGPRPLHRQRRTHVGRGAGRHDDAGPAGRGARLRALLGRRAPQHGDRRQHVAARADRPPRRVDVVDPHRLGRRDAAQPRRRSSSPSSSPCSRRCTPAASTSASAGRPAPTRRRRPPCAAPPTLLGAEDFPRDLLDLMGLLGDERVEHGAWSRFRATPAADVAARRSCCSARAATRPRSPASSASAFGFAHHFDMPAACCEACELYRDSLPPVAASSPSRTRSSPPACSPPTTPSRPSTSPARPAWPILGIRTNRPHAAAAARRGGRAPRHRRRPVDAVERASSTTARARWRRLLELAERTQAVELMISTMTYGLPERIRTLELLAEHWPAVDADGPGRRAGAGPGAGRRRRRHHPAAVRRPATVTVDWKANHTEVTALDRGAEAADRRSTGAPSGPTTACSARSTGSAGDPTSPWQWIVDPIDGTSGYVRGHPGLGDADRARPTSGDVVVAVVSAPALGRRWWASRGGGAFADGRPCRVSAVDATRRRPGQHHAQRRLGRARSHAGARRAGPGGAPQRAASATSGSTASSPRARSTSPSTPSASRPTTSPPSRLLVEEAGGTFTDRHGAPTHETDTAISTNGLLHAEVLRRLAAPR